MRTTIVGDNDKGTATLIVSNDTFSSNNFVTLIIDKESIDVSLNTLYSAIMGFMTCQEEENKQQEHLTVINR